LIQLDNLLSFFQLIIILESIQTMAISFGNDILE